PLSLLLPPSLLLSSRLLYQCALRSVGFSSSPPSHSFPVSQWQQLREAAVCVSTSLLLQVKTAASLDAANSKEGRVGWEVLAAVFASPRSGVECTILIISKKTSRTEGRAEDLSYKTDRSQAD
ncbi:hypothetical protein GOODEAATRI_009608, partial [Goodea atripinnis]